MPIYEFGCEKCGHVFEEIVFTGDNSPVCPQCGHDKTVKLVSACARRSGKSGSDSDFSFSASSGGGCSGCSGGNCASCGR